MLAMLRLCPLIVVCSFWIIFLGLPLAEGDGSNRIRDNDRNRPSNVFVEVLNDTSIFLSWDPPRDSNTGKCPVKKYAIRLKMEGSKRSRTWKIGGNRQSVTLNDLAVGSIYHVRLLAVDCDGKGKPSQWTRVQTTDGDMSAERKNDSKEMVPPGKPTYVRTRTFSDSVIVSWLPPEDDVTLRGYMIGYGEGVPDVNWQYVEATSTNVTIRNLKPATQYILSLRAFNNAGKGPVVYDLIYTREFSATTVGPSSAPTDLKAKILSPTTVWLQWIDPSLGRIQQLTDNRYYNVHYHPTTPSVGKTLSVIVKAFHIVLYDLLPGTRYEFKVRMVKDSQASPFSRVIANKTFETAPSSAPRGLGVVATNVSRSVIVSWRPPRHPNGDMSGYLVLFTDDSEQPVERWKVQSVSGEELSTTIANLEPNKTYHFKVQGRNSNGYSPMSSSTVYYTKVQSLDRQSSAAVPDPASVDVIGNSSAVLEKDARGNGGGSSGEKTEAEAEISGPEAERKRENVEDYSNGGIDDDQDDDKSESAAQVVVESPGLRSSGDGKSKREPSNNDHPTFTLPEPTNRDGMAGSSLATMFRSIVHYQVSAYVTWPETLTRCEGNDEWLSSLTAVFGYLFRYTEHVVDRPERFVTRNLTNNFILLDDLVPDSTYRYQVKYLFRGGTQSSWSGESTFDTHYRRSY